MLLGKSTPAPLQQAIARCTNSIRETTDKLSVTVESVFKCIWQNPSFKPQEVVAGFGTNAGELFGMLALFASAIGQANVLDGNDIPAPSALPQGWSHVVNPDGTVTLAAPAPAAPAAVETTVK